jgi:hypothetical protein
MLYRTTRLLGAPAKGVSKGLEIEDVRRGQVDRVDVVRHRYVDRASNPGRSPEASSAGAARAPDQRRFLAAPRQIT